MGLFDFLKKNDKPSPEEQILNTKVQLEQLKDKYADLLEIQRRILKGDPTPREKSLAEAKIRSGICAYTICAQASKDLDEITSDIELNKSLKSLNAALKAVNKAGKEAEIGGVRRSINKQVEKLKSREDNVNPEDIFTENSLGTVDAWLGEKWDSVAAKYIGGERLSVCLRESLETLESAPMPSFLDGSIFGSGKDGSTLESAEDELKDLLNSDIF